ncbi:selenoneine biosynthesis selenosugar synthase SenB [Thiobacter aerophilum]|uniref:Selenoneine biosynthesis selenosugar synthase SenB n=1 Tax=Thiobacter aerophilum TaxID=3121275 RepID=A0ABV0EAK7_9BURK
MRIVIVTPAGPRQRTGNRQTALRWARLLRQLGHQVWIATRWEGQPADLLIALHARRSRRSIHRFHFRHPTRPLVVVLTGTDLYRDLPHDAAARRSLDMASRVVVLQEEGRRALSGRWRRKTSVVYQSAPAGQPLPPDRDFTVCVVGHLREEKDPFRCAQALCHLPPTSRIQVRHLGRALDGAHETQARYLNASLPRYHWLGEVDRRQVRAIMRQSRLLVVSSRMEGGANVIAEALAVGLPVLASQVPGNVGMLGRDYAGYFPVGDERTLAMLLGRAESNPAFLASLAAQCQRRARRMTPARERRALARVIDSARRRAQKRHR